MSDFSSSWSPCRLSSWLPNFISFGRPPARMSLTWHSSMTSPSCGRHGWCLSWVFYLIRKEIKRAHMWERIWESFEVQDVQFSRLFLGRKTNFSVDSPSLHFSSRWKIHTHQLWTCSRARVRCCPSPPSICRKWLLRAAAVARESANWTQTSSSSFNYRGCSVECKWKAKKKTLFT